MMGDELLTADRPISDHLNESLNAVMNRLPPSSGKGYFESTATTSGMEVQVGHNIGKNWLVGGYASMLWGQPAQAGVRVSGKW